MCLFASDLAPSLFECDRLCVAIPKGGDVPSGVLVLDAGASGKVYCEPRSAVTLNNNLSVAYAEMKNAEEAVLWSLTSQVVDRVDHFSHLLQVRKRRTTPLFRIEF